MFRRMQHECSVAPNEVTFVSVLGAAEEASELRMIHDRAAENGFHSSNVFVGNSLVHMHGKCGSVRDAKQLFDAMALQSVSSWNSIVDAYAHNGLEREAFKLFRTMQHEGVRPDKVTFLTVLEVCTSLRQVRLLQELVTSAGLRSDVLLQTALLQVFARNSSISDAKRTFDGVRDKDLFAWNTLLTAYAQCGADEAAVEMFHRMNQEGVKAGEQTFVSVIDSCASLGDLEQGVRAHECAAECGVEDQVRMLHAQICSAGLLRDVAVANCLINAYRKCQSLEDAKVVFQSIQDYRDVVSWTSMLCSCVEDGSHYEAFELWHWMQQYGDKPDTVTFAGILDACSSLKSLSRGRMIHEQVKGSGYDSSTTVSPALIGMYSECFSLEEAAEAFETAAPKDVLLYNSMISAYSKHGRGGKAIALFRRMDLEGVSFNRGTEGLKPDNVALMSVASVCQHVGLLEEAFYYLFQLGTEYRVTAKRERYSCIVGLLGRIGWLEEAEAVIRKMPFKPNEAVWKNLLMSCKIHNDVARGARVAKELLELDSADSATYVTLYNMYAGQLKHSEEPQDFELDELEEARLDA
ncbi:hypothetical protein SELMODRAFT_412514 [Selaginella moellendorffii]|uniref:Pentacotripeptide-repeat region of PRORP domain-containing protein n=1 Tax=Selaginella moellendorffii TaxID=88036 RepID=D8RLQ4_SELML|nr:hypothetical protein SELMODRAFT_412514 [Selaginella moellendorffii]